MSAEFLHYRLELLEPVIARAFGGDPNSAASLPYIPGSTLRGALLAALSKGGSTEPLVDRLLDCIYRGVNVYFLPAYPEVSGMRSIPAPRSFRRTKHAKPGDNSVWDLSGNSTAGSGTPGENPSGALEQTPAAVGEPFWLPLAADHGVLCEPRFRTRTHQRRDRAKGFSTKTTGALYAYHSLAEGQRFRGVIVLSAGAAELTGSFQRVTGRIGVGRSLNAEYATALLSWCTDAPASAESEVLVGGVKDCRCSGVVEGGEFRMLLLSPAVIRRAETGAIDPQAITEALGSGAALVRSRSFTATERVGSFNRKWGLEVPQATAIAAGSILVFRSASAIDAKRIEMLEQAGIGERRADGYGRFVLLKPATADTLMLGVQAPDAVQAESVTSPSTAQPPGAVDMMQRRILDAMLLRLIEGEAFSLARSAQSIPSPNLLGRLRTVTRQAPAAAQVTLKGWLGSDNTEPTLRRPALDALSRCRMRYGNHEMRLSELVRLWLSEDWSSATETRLSVLKRERRGVLLDASFNACFSNDSEYFLRVRVSRINALLAALMLAARKNEEVP